MLKFRQGSKARPSTWHLTPSHAPHCHFPLSFWASELPVQTGFLADAMTQGANRGILILKAKGSKHSFPSTWCILPGMRNRALSGRCFKRTKQAPLSYKGPCHSKGRPGSHVTGEGCCALTSSDSSDSVCRRMGKRLSVCRNICGARAGTVSSPLLQAWAQLGQGPLHGPPSPTPTLKVPQAPACQGLSRAAMTQTLPCRGRTSEPRWTRKAPRLGGTSGPTRLGLTLRGVLM